MNELLDRGITIKSAVFKADENSKRVLKNGYTYHDSEPYALMIGDKIKDSAPETLGNDIVKATREVLED